MRTAYCVLRKGRIGRDVYRCNVVTNKTIRSAKSHGVTLRVARNTRGVSDFAGVTMGPIVVKQFAGAIGYFEERQRALIVVDGLQL